MSKVKVNFSLEKLKGRNIGVHCKTKNQAKNFINWAYNLNNTLNNTTDRNYYYKRWRDNFCFIINKDLTLECGNTHFYFEECYKIIDYEEALIK